MIIPTSVMGIGVNAVRSGIKHLNITANEIATVPIQALEAVGGQQARTNNLPPKRDLVEPLLKQKEALYQAQAGVVVIKAADSNLGDLLNIFA